MVWKKGIKRRGEGRESVFTLVIYTAWHKLTIGPTIHTLFARRAKLCRETV